MPIIICRFCEYIGQGKTADEKWEDVEEHEGLCLENLDGDY